MPKSQKQKKAKVADFTKSKFKVGKGKQVPSNATDTSYSSKTIGLPAQSIGVDKGDVPVTRRNQTLDDLFVQSKHYSAATRKDSLLGLKEILTNYPSLYKAHLGGIVHHTARLIPDEDASVRKGLRAFYSWFLPLIPKDTIAPFLSTILFFATSALANIFPEVRLDAVPIIDLLLAISSEAVTAGGISSRTDRSASQTASGLHGQRILTAYLALLGVGTEPGGTASTSQLSPTSKVLILKSLSAFIALSTAGTTDEEDRPTVPIWYLPPIFSSRDGFEAFLGLLPSTSAASTNEGRKGEMSWIANAVPADISSTHRHLFEKHPLARDLWSVSPLISLPSSTEELQRLLAAAESKTSLPSDSLANGPVTSASLLRLLHPLLLSTFLDAAPSAFAPSGILNSTPSAAPDVHLETVWCVGRIARDLWRATAISNDEGGLERADLRKLATLLEKMGAYFVFGEDELRKRDTKSLGMLQDLNLIYSELVALLVLSQPGGTLPAKVAAQLDRVAEYVVAVLTGEVTTASHPIGTTLSPASYAALLPTVWSLLSTSAAPAATPSSLKGLSVFEALLDHFASLSAASETKALGFVFLARTCLMEDLPGCQMPFNLAALPQSSQQKLASWFRSLPKYLWELGTKHLETTTSLLSFLHRAASRPLLRFAEELPALAPLLVPYFYVSRTQASFAGPYARLPERLKPLARGVAAYVAEEAEEAGAPLLEAVAKAYA